MAAQLPSVDVVRSGPADLTVNVVVGWFDDDQQRTLAEGVIDLWSGLTTYNDEHTRTVYLNLKTTFKKGRKFVAAHEMGHAFGLAHNNTHHGVMNHSDWFDTTTMSPEEVAALEAAYAPLTD
jgi:Zn-dependent peptidase ImmA (M78 family)